MRRKRFLFWRRAAAPGLVALALALGAAGCDSGKGGRLRPFGLTPAPERPFGLTPTPKRPVEPTSQPTPHTKPVPHTRPSP
jgi:hypothetical protein